MKAKGIRSDRIDSLSGLMSPDAVKLLSAKGTDLVHEIGIDVIRGVVLEILSGKNLRDSTEVLTRRRVTALNLSIVNLFLKGSAISSSFVRQLPDLAVNLLLGKHIAKSERWLAQWVLGLTDKAFQNVLRDNPDSLAEYRDRYVKTCLEVIANHEKECGTLKGVLEISPSVKAEVNWLFMVYLLNTIGAQTLAIRGSEKSAYGKLFEKLVLGSLLHIFGFKHVSQKDIKRPRRVFWLASRGERRESDATLLYDAGKGVRFDIGFIGRGNPEISLDKVTRFEREISLGRSRWYMATVVIVDRIGKNSRIERLAKGMGATIVQMSGGYWPQQIARELNRVLGFKHKLVDMKQNEITEFLKEAISRVPLEDFIAGNNTG